MAGANTGSKGEQKKPRPVKKPELPKKETKKETKR